MTSRPSPRARPLPRTAALLASLLAVLATAAPQGCGPEEPVFDAAVKHTPETLVEEFVARYERLPANRKPDRAAAKPKGSAPDVDEAGKSSRKEAATKSEMLKESETLEAALATLEERLGTVPGMTRADAARQAADLLDKHPALKPEDRKLVVDRLKKLD